MNPLNEDLRGLARLLGFKTLNHSPEHKLFQAVERHQQRIGGVDLDPAALECVAIWRTLQAPNEPTLIVTSTALKGFDFIEACRQRLADSATVSRYVWVANKNEGLCLAHGSDLSVFHMRPYVLDQADKAGKTGMILIPDLDDIPGCFVRSMCQLPASQIRTLVVNAAR